MYGNTVCQKVALRLIDVQICRNKENHVGKANNPDYINPSNMSALALVRNTNAVQMKSEGQHR